MRPLATALGRYFIVGAGPIGSAAAQFALTLILLRHLSAEAFGSFAFLLVASQLFQGVWGALFCAPLPVITAMEADPDRRTRARRAMFSTCLVGTLLAFFVLWALGSAVGVGATAALSFAAYSALALLRWAARARAFVAGEPMRTVLSDLTFASITLAGTAMLETRAGASLDLAFGMLLVATVAGLFPFGRAYFTEQFRHISLADIGGYRPIWSEHARWSLLGVVTTEMTGNAHVYLVTFAYGPERYAAIAAGALLIRPIQVAQNALGEYERAHIAVQLGNSDLMGALRSVRLCRWVLVAGWIGTVLTAMALLRWAPRLIFPPQYALSELEIALVLWMVVAAVRLLRAPESTFLQAAGAFSDLARATVISCGWSLVAVLVMLALGGPLWSIAGILLGELVCAAMIWRQAGAWRATKMARLPANWAEVS